MLQSFYTPENDRKTSAFLGYPKKPVEWKGLKAKHRGNKISITSIFWQMEKGEIYLHRLICCIFFKKIEGQFFKKMIEESVCSITKMMGKS